MSTQLGMGWSTLTQMERKRENLSIVLPNLNFIVNGRESLNCLNKTNAVKTTL